MPRREPLEAEPPPDLPDGAEAVEVAAGEAPLSDEGLEALGEMERKSKISRTDTQAGIGSMTLILLLFLAAYFRLDMNPYEEGYQAGLPLIVEGALFGVGTAIAVRVMNRK